MKINETQVKKDILNFVNLKNEKIKLSDKLDSLQYLKLFFFLEKKLKIKFSEKDFNSKKIDTINGLISIIKKNNLATFYTFQLNYSNF